MRDHPNLIDGLLQKWQKIKIEESENKKTKYQLPTIRKIPYLALSFSVMATLGILGKVCIKFLQNDFGNANNLIFDPPTHFQLKPEINFFDVFLFYEI